MKKRLVTCLLLMTVAAAASASTSNVVRAIEGGYLGRANSFYECTGTVTYVSPDMTFGNTNSFLLKTSIKTPGPDLLVTTNGVIVTNVPAPEIVNDDVRNWITFDYTRSISDPITEYVSPYDPQIDIGTDDMYDLSWESRKSTGLDAGRYIFYRATSTNSITTPLPRKIHKIKPRRFDATARASLLASYEAFDERINYASEGQHGLYHKKKADPTAGGRKTQFAAVEPFRDAIASELMLDGHHDPGESLIWMTNGIKTATIEVPNVATEIVPHWWSSSLINTNALFWPEVSWRLIDTWTDGQSYAIHSAYSNAALSFLDFENSQATLREPVSYAIRLADIDGTSSRLQDIAIAVSDDYGSMPLWMTNVFESAYNSYVDRNEDKYETWSHDDIHRNLPKILCNVDQALAIMDRTIHIPSITNMTWMNRDDCVDNSRLYSITSHVTIAISEGEVKPLGHFEEWGDDITSHDRTTTTNESRYLFRKWYEPYTSYTGGRIAGTNWTAQVCWMNTNDFTDIIKEYERDYPTDPCCTNTLAYATEMLDDPLRVEVRIWGVLGTDYTFSPEYETISLIATGYIDYHIYMEYTTPLSVQFEMGPTQPGLDGESKIKKAIAGFFKHVKVEYDDERGTSNYWASTYQSYDNRSQLENLISQQYMWSQDSVGKEIIDLFPIDTSDILPPGWRSGFITVGDQVDANYAVSGKGYITYTNDCDGVFDPDSILVHPNYRMSTGIKPPCYMSSVGFTAVLIAHPSWDLTFDPGWTAYGRLQPITCVDWDWENMKLIEQEIQNGNRSQ